MEPKIIGNYIQQMTRKSPLKSKDDLIKLLKNWLETSGETKTIGDLKGRRSNPTPLIWLEIDKNLYKIHADTKREGIVQFLKNENPWRVILNKRGKCNKVTNHPEGEDIEGLYFYSETIGERII